MPFAHIFAQYKISYDVLTRLTHEQQVSLDRAVVGSNWTKDINGSLLSPVQPLALPALTPQNSEEVLTLEWPDTATRALASSAAYAQLLVCDAYSYAPRSDMIVYHVGMAAQVDGQPLPMYSSVPRPVVTEVQRQFRGAIGKGNTDVRTYRAIPVGEQIRVLEIQLVARKRDNQVTKVKSVDVFDVEVVQSGMGSLVQLQRRATLRESDPHAPPVTLLGGTPIRPMMLHALSNWSLGAYALVDGKPPIAPGPKAELLLISLTQAKKPPELLPPSPPVPPIPIPPNPILPVPVPPEPPSPPQPFPAPPDPWVRLLSQMAVDPQVLDLARATLKRHRPLLLTGPPGTGKTLLATLLAEAVCGDGHYTLVTADARWTSSEVLGGLKVVPGATLRYGFTPGIVTRAAQAHTRSVAAGGPPHALIIDEFNRAHQDEAFGRLLTLLDPAYRTKMPLVGPDDGAPEAVTLPDDFLLIATMNNADSARLHDLSAALQRRFTTVKMTVPPTERTFLEVRYTSASLADFNRLYGLVGTGHEPEGGPLRLRAVQSVGTHFMCETLAYLEGGLSLDAALGLMVEPLLGSLTLEDLKRLGATARAEGLDDVMRRLVTAAAAAAF